MKRRSRETNERRQTNKSLTMKEDENNGNGKKKLEMVRNKKGRKWDVRLKKQK
jgi:hypothetical protein